MAEGNTRRRYCYGDEALFPVEEFAYFEGVLLHVLSVSTGHTQAEGWPATLEATSAAGAWTVKTAVVERPSLSRASIRLEP